MMYCVSYVLLGYDCAFLVDYGVCQQDCGFFHRHHHDGVDYADVDLENGDDGGWVICVYPHVAERVYDVQDLVNVCGHQRENDVWAMDDVLAHGASELEQQLSPVHQFVHHPYVSLHFEPLLESHTQCRQILY